MTRNRTSATGAARPRRPRLNRRQVMLDLRWAMLSLYAAAFSAIMYYERVRDVTLDTSLRIGAMAMVALVFLVVATAILPALQTDERRVEMTQRASLKVGTGLLAVAMTSLGGSDFVAAIRDFLPSLIGA